MKILNELLDGVSVLNSHGNVNNSVSSISLNSKVVEENSLFVALAGNVVDGHSFIEEVINKGAKVIIYEKELDEYKKGITYIKVPDSHKAVGVISSNFYDNPSHKLKLIGVTGTNGKTTVVTLLHQLFYKLGNKVGMIGTVVNKINEESFEAERTTPDSITLNKLLSDMVNAGCKYCFMEVSSHSVSEKRISGLNFSGGVFTNLTLDHLDYHKTLKNYRNAKKGFFEILPTNAFALTNIDDPNGLIIVKSTKAKKYTYGFKNKADFNQRLESKLIGEFNLYNILAVYGTTILLEKELPTSDDEQNIDRNKILEIIKTLDPVPGRFQYIKSENNITGIVDYAHTPDALDNVLKTIVKMRKENSKIISVIGCGGDRDKSKRPIMARLGYEMSDILILTSDNPRTENPEKIIEDMKKGIEIFHLENKVYIITDRYSAIEKACSLAEQGDYVLVAGKGHEKYQEVNGVKTHFDDMEELKRYI